MKLNKWIKKQILINSFFIGLFSAAIVPSYAAEHGDEHDEESESGMVELKNNSESLYKIKVEKLQLSDVAKRLTAPAEIKLNAYSTAIVALRIDGQIVKRLAKLGDIVIKGQPLASISSIPMSEAQQAYILNVKEWRRVKELGKKVVSGKRFIEARAKWQSSLARLKAYGLDDKQLQQLEKQQNPEGLFNLNSPIDGVIMKDDFLEGQYAAAGTQLFMVSDESVIWAEASVSPAQAALFKAGDLAEIKYSSTSYSGKVIQIGHTVSETTRTQIVRIEIDNSKDNLHPGQFVTATMSQSKSEKRMVLPESAVVRTADGDWGVFIEVKARHYKQVEVEVVDLHGELMIIEGLSLGTPVVVEGAFYLSAELAKAGFDPHGH